MKKIDVQMIIEEVAEAIARQEGFYATGTKVPTIARRLNNPGNLRSWKDPSGVEYPNAQGFAHFPSEALGWRALKAQCRINIVKRELTAYEFFAGKSGVYAGYAPRADRNNPDAYAKFVLGRLSKAFGFSVEERLMSAPDAQGRRRSLPLIKLVGEECV